MKIYENQPVRIVFNPGIGTSTITDSTLNYKSPDGTQGAFTPVEILSSSELFYDAAPGDFPEVGSWLMWATITTLQGTYPTDPFIIDVAKVSQIPICTRSFVKNYLAITDDSTDAIIDSLIELATQEYLDIRNVPWDVDDLGLDVYPKGSNITVAEMIGYKLSTRLKQGREVSSESIDAYSVSYTSSSFRGYPSSITSTIKKYISLE